MTTNSDATPENTPSLSVRSFGLTDRGRVRENNEDHFLIAELTKALRVWHTSLPAPGVTFSDERAHLFLVADGMGGHRAGERASALAVLAIEQFTLNTFKWFFETSGPEAQHLLSQLQTALEQADVAILEKAAEDPSLRGMGTTVTMAYQLGAQLCVFHVGDSRAYIYRNDELYQLTKDHTVVAELLRAGTIQPEEAKRHNLRHIVTNVVGGPKVGVDVEVHAVELHAGDLLLLCSDGLNEMVSNDAIGAALREVADPEAACRRLVDEANAAGGRDNITVVIARFESGTADS